MLGDRRAGDAVGVLVRDDDQVRAVDAAADNRRRVPERAGRDDDLPGHGCVAHGGSEDFVLGPHG